MTNTPDLNLNSCDRDPIHLIASVQPSGFLMTYSTVDLKIRNVSENISRFLGISHELAIGRPLAELLPSDWVYQMTPQLKKVSDDDRPIHLEKVQLSDGATLDCYFYASDGLGCLEFEPSVTSTSSIQFQERINEVLAEIRRAPDLTQAAQALARGVRQLTDLDRVMVYRFMPKVWHGEVIAEDRIASAQPFLHHRFPATDIPKPARDLYLRNQVRFIHDARMTGAKVCPSVHPTTGKVLNLQDSRLRAVPNVHLEYLKNMGVVSSFSVAIIVHSELWGLISCHHFSPLHLSHQVRSACELLSQAFSLRAQSEEQLVAIQEQVQFESELRRFVARIRDKRNPLQDFLKDHETLSRLFKASGVAVVTESHVDLAGLTPTVSELKEMMKIVGQRMQAHHQTYLATMSIAELNPAWEFFKTYASGLLALQISEVPEGYLFIFRPEVVQTIEWGGDPRKVLEKRSYQGPINPRVSFETWRETIHAHSNQWTDYEIAGAQFLKEMVFETFIFKERLIQELNEKILNRA